MPAAPGAPPLGQPSMNAAQVNAAYQQAFGRGASSSELASELENANKYSAQGILNTIAARTNNNPGSGEQGSANWASLNSGNPNLTSMAAVAGGALPAMAQYAPMPQIAQMQIGPMPTGVPQSPTFQTSMASLAGPAPTSGFGWAGDPNNGLMLARQRRGNGYGV